MLLNIDYLRELNIYSMVLRIFLAMLAGGIIGFEREKKRRPAGFRTYMLVSLGAALTVILGQYLHHMTSIEWGELCTGLGIRTDALRFSAQVINGVGFLGAGTVLVTSRQEVKGLTTATALWTSACMGIATGAGFYELTIICLLLMRFCMKLLPMLESAIVAKSRNFNVYVEMENILSLGALVGRLKAENITIFNVDIDKEEHEHMSQINALFSLRLPKKRQHTEILAALSTVDGIISIEEF